jgi:hypothetical protein
MRRSPPGRWQVRGDTPAAEMGRCVGATPRAVSHKTEGVYEQATAHGTAPL